MKSEDSSDDYRAFLLRLWREEKAAPWRVWLQDAHTGESQGFASLERLYAYLLQEVERDEGQE